MTKVVRTITWGLAEFEKTRHTHEYCFYYIGVLWLRRGLTLKGKFAWWVWSLVGFENWGPKGKILFQGVSMETSSSAASSKRARAPVNGTHVVSCLVDGCRSDLSKCRDYHRRHKVCELHSKTPKVTIGGLERRFCQQCSRFHSLVEFDEGKRSCRKRLDGHNRRRRKPQLESLSINSARFLSSHQGSRSEPFSSAQILPSAVVSCAWTAAIKAETNTTLFNPQLNYIETQSSIHGSYSQSYKLEKHFPLLEGAELTLEQPPMKLFSDGLVDNNRVNRVSNSNSALSLLSSPTTETRVRDTGLAHMVHSSLSASSLAPSLIDGLHFSGLDRYSCSQGTEDDERGNSNSVMYQVTHDHGSSASESPKTFPFSWD